MLRRTHKLALALFIAGFIVLSTGCTSSRMMKSSNNKLANWLSAKKSDTSDSAYPAPSSFEVPESVKSPYGVSSPANRGPSATSVATDASPTAGHPLVQRGFYDVPASSPTSPPIAESPTPQAIPPTTPQTGNLYTTAPATPIQPTGPVNPVATQPVAALPSTPPAPSEFLPVNHERSIYESEPTYTASAATHDAPLYTNATPMPSVALVTAEEVATQPASSVTAATYSAPAQTTPANNGTFYQSQANQPRPWRPGSTSDLKTL